MKQNAITYSVLATGFIILSALILLGWYNAQPALGSSVVGNDYIATSTAANAVYGAQTGDFVLKGGVTKSGGSFGSVIVQGANTGSMHFYDATTTDATKRAAHMSTSSIHIASLPASLAAGTYTFDVEFKNGLLLDLDGAAPTTTITYR